MSGGQRAQKGWLSRWTRKQWSRHWFVLKSGSLTYYRGPAAELCSFLDGVLDLSLIKHIELAEGPGSGAPSSQQHQQHQQQHQQHHFSHGQHGQQVASGGHFAFSLKMWNGECHVLAAGSQAERQLWLEAINECSKADDETGTDSASSSDSSSTNLGATRHARHFRHEPLALDQLALSIRSAIRRREAAVELGAEASVQKVAEAAEPKEMKLYVSQHSAGPSDDEEEEDEEEEEEEEEEDEDEENEEEDGERKPEEKLEGAGGQQATASSKQKKRVTFDLSQLSSSSSSSSGGGSDDDSSSVASSPSSSASNSAASSDGEEEEEQEQVAPPVAADRQLAPPSAPESPPGGAAEQSQPPMQAPSSGELEELRQRLEAALEQVARLEAQLRSSSQSLGQLQRELADSSERHRCELARLEAHREQLAAELRRAKLAHLANNVGHQSHHQSHQPAHQGGQNKALNCWLRASQQAAQHQPPLLLMHHHVKHSVAANQQLLGAKLLSHSKQIQRKLNELELKVDRMRAAEQ